MARACGAGRAGRSASCKALRASLHALASCGLFLAKRILKGFPRLLDATFNFDVDLVAIQTSFGQI